MTVEPNRGTISAPSDTHPAVAAWVRLTNRQPHPESVERVASDAREKPPGKSQLFRLRFAGRESVIAKLANAKTMGKNRIVA